MYYQIFKDLDKIVFLFDDDAEIIFDPKEKSVNIYGDFNPEWRVFIENSCCSIDNIVKYLNSKGSERIYYHPGMNRYYTESSWPKKATYVAILGFDILAKILAKNDREAKETFSGMLDPYFPRWKKKGKSVKVRDACCLSKEIIDVCDLVDRKR